MRKSIWFCILAVFAGSGCAFFNTYFNARKNYLQAQDQIRKMVRDGQKRSTGGTLSRDRLDPEPNALPENIRQQMDVVIEKANKVVALHPDSRWVDEAILLMGKALYYRGDYLDARNRFEVFMSQYPDNEKFAEARLWYARTLIRLNRISDAIEHLRAVSEESRDAGVRARSAILSGDAAMEERTYERAAQFYKSAATIATDLTVRQEALYKTAFAHWTAGQYAAAERVLGDLRRTSLDPEEVFDFTLMGVRCLKEMSRYDEALHQVNLLLADFRYSAYFAAAEFEAADILRRKGETELAVEQLKKLIAGGKAPAISGNAYYVLALLHDEGEPRENLDLAKRYYSLVANKYTQGEHTQEARLRFQQLQSMEFLRGYIRADQDLLALIDQRLAGDSVQAPVDTVQEENGLGFDAETLRDLARQDSILKAGGKLDESDYAEVDENKDRFESNQSSADEVSSVDVENKELKEKLAQCAMVRTEILSMTDRDAMLRRREVIRMSVADGYFRLAEHFHHRLHDMDSARITYQRIAAEFAGTFQEERALYGVAGVYQQQGSSAWRPIVEDVLARFPDGAYSFLGRQWTGSISSGGREADLLAEAEKQMLEGHYPRAIPLLEEAALSDTLTHKLRALYTLGLIHEKWIDEPRTAIRYYHTLTLVDGSSAWATSVRPKVEAYGRERGLSDSAMIDFVDGRFFKKLQESVKQDSAIQLLADTASVHVDTARAVVPDTAGIVEPDTAKTRFILDEDDERIRINKQREKKKKNIEKEARKEDDLEE